VNKKKWMAVLGGFLTAAPALAWAGSEVYSALKEAAKIPVLEERLNVIPAIEKRLDEQSKDVRELRRYTMEMLMIQHREFGDNRRADELKEELKKLKEVK
jgi:hypothetical protein